MINETQIDRRKHLLTTPRAAAVAGILSAGMIIAAQVIMRLYSPSATTETGAALVERAGMFSIILRLMPFAGIFFLWFMGVTRDRLGDWEDKFFSTVFLGSGLLYLAMIFTAAAIGGGIMVSYPLSGPAQGEAVFKFAQATIDQFIHVYSVRMAAVFMLSSATMWQRTGVMPRPLAFLTYVLALGLLVLVNFSLWVTLVFPVWMLVVSILILIYNYQRTAENKVEPLTNI